MPAKRTTLMMIGFPLLCILLGLFAGYEGGIVIKTAAKEMAQNSRENSEYGTSIKSVRVTIQADQQELLFDQLRQFAKKEFFAIRITTTSFDSSYHVEMWREDVQIGGSFYPDSGELGLGLLRNSFEQRPPQPISVAVLEDLANDLQSFISEVPSAIITEMRHRLIITTTDKWRTEELLAQMKALAEKHSLKYESSFDDSSLFYTCLDLAIRGEGFHITTHDCDRDTIKDFNIDFYLDYHKTPTAKSEETLDELFNELKSVFGNIDNAVVKEQP
jgi:hypothetical protein